MFVMANRHSADSQDPSATVFGPPVRPSAASAKKPDDTNERAAPTTAPDPEDPFNIDWVVPTLRRLMAEVAEEEDAEATRREWRLAHVVVAVVVALTLLVMLGLVEIAGAAAGLLSAV
jgi:hypothetical protein